MDEDRNTRVEALLTVARAFLDRGSTVQYDELSMDRICRITPRRELYSPPEKATKQHILFLDCSSFVFSTFYQAFNYCFKADVTSDMINLKDIRVFYYEITGIETDEEKTSVMKSFKDTLRAGDVIVTVYNTNGHTMLYAGNDIFYHCSSNGKKGSYNYQQRHDNIYERGAISNISSSVLFSPEINGTPSRSYLFRDVNLKFCILRPLSDVGAITFSTQKRVEGLKNIRSSVTSSHPEGKSIRLGEEITYNVEVVNLDTSERNIKIMYKKEEISFCLKAGESTNKLYTEVIKSDMVDGRYICKPEITVNNMGIHVPEVIFDNNSLHDFLLPAPEVIIKDLFIKQNKVEGEVYCLRKISHFSSMLVPGLFGGFGVITPEIVQSPDIRTHRITISSLQQGDLIIYKDSMDAPAVGVKYYGDGNLDFAEDTEASTFIDSLFGRFCFCVIRQSLYKAQGEGGEYAF